jgi:hypothetical protein
MARRIGKDFAVSSTYKIGYSSPDRNASSNL